MRIDAHVEQAPDWLGRILERNRFEGCVMVGSDAAQRHAFVLAVAVPLDLADPRLAHKLDELQRDARCKGVVHRGAILDPQGARELEARGLSLDLLIAAEELPLVPRLAGQAPDLCIAIDHMARPASRAGFDTWAAGISAAAALPGVYCKVSGLIAGPGWKADELRPYVAHVLSAFGADRVMFGSGWPFASKGCIWKESLAAFTQSIGAQPIEIREKLLGGTAANFYRLRAGRSNHA